jgi:hypothetical protein
MARVLPGHSAVVPSMRSRMRPMLSSLILAVAVVAGSACASEHGGSGATGDGDGDAAGFDAGGETSAVDATGTNCFAGSACSAGQTCSYATDYCSHTCSCEGGKYRCTTTCSPGCAWSVTDTGDCKRHCDCVPASSASLAEQCVDNCGAARDCPESTPGDDVCSLPDGVGCNYPASQASRQQTCLCRDDGSGERRWVCSDRPCGDGSIYGLACPTDSCMFFGGTMFACSCDASPTGVRWSCDADAGDGGDAGDTDASDAGGDGAADDAGDAGT